MALPLALLLALLAAPLSAVGPLRAAVVGRLARLTLTAAGVRLQITGRPTQAAALLVANHISWLDALALLAAMPSARLVAKREVRGWPLIGAIAGANGTIFLDRSRPRSLTASVADVARVLRSGTPVACFPEGTSWCGAAGGRFRPALFQSAVDAGVPVRPVTVRYRSAEAATTAAAFVGADTLWASVRRVLAAPDLCLQLTLGQALHPGEGASRRSLARIAQRQGVG
ncbi:lysophospholipid acyltransferase family protein [Pilimelia columellifera subsp. columellifera]|uniref:Lysophospholipid acyltransferase family protein n=1 Tax=Pilimelia columellifera subsp. columellifera TaxID=706583 RepID=A0ABN3N7Y0_9ACTN